MKTLLRKLAVFVIALSSYSQMTSQTQNYLTTSGNKLYDISGDEVRLTGVNWFGFETALYSPHGIWSRDMKSVLQQIKDLGFNTIRVPWCNEMLDPGASVNVNSYGTDAYSGVSPMNVEESTVSTPIELLDIFVDWCQENDMKIVLDNHSRAADAFLVEGSWFTDEYPEERWINDWVFMAERYKGKSAVVGMDLNNEPHGSTWGNSNPSTDWNKAAERCGNAVLAVNPDVLIIVEGVGEFEGDSYWWGGQLMGAESYPVVLSDPSKLMYSAHEYGPEVSQQDWFEDPTFPNNMPQIWEDHFDYLYESETSPIFVGEFGIKDQEAFDGIAFTWFTEYMDFMGDRYSWTFWTMNPNSGDTGGILQDDWTSVNQWKLDVLTPHMAQLIPNVVGDDQVVEEEEEEQEEGESEGIVSTNGKLQVEGNQIINESGTPFSMAGNSLFWSGFETTGGKFYTTEVVDHLAQNWNSGLVRAAMAVEEADGDGGVSPFDETFPEERVINVDGSGYFNDPEGELAKIKTIIDAAIANDVYVVVDFHTHFAHFYKEEAITFFTEIATTYGDNDHIIYEIFNEPIGTANNRADGADSNAFSEESFNATWNDIIRPYAIDVINTIRAIDPDNLIIVGTPGFSQAVHTAAANPIVESDLDLNGADLNIAYTLHFYAAQEEHDALIERATTAMDNGIALFVTEWGTVEASGDGVVDQDQTLVWMNFMKENNISHTNWSITDKFEGSAVVSGNADVAGFLNDELTSSGNFVRCIVEGWDSGVFGSCEAEIEEVAEAIDSELIPNGLGIKFEVERPTALDANTNSRIDFISPGLSVDSYDGEGILSGFQEGEAVVIHANDFLPADSYTVQIVVSSTAEDNFLVLLRDSGATFLGGDFAPNTGGLNNYQIVNVPGIVFDENAQDLTIAIGGDEPSGTLNIESFYLIPDSEFTEVEVEEEPQENVEIIESNLEVAYREAGSNPTNNSINPHFEIINTGDTSVDYADLSIRYWFTTEDSNEFNFWCDWAQLGTDNVQGTFGEALGMNYLEVSFLSDAGSLEGNASSGNIQNRLAKTDWSNFDESNDYSYDPTKVAFTLHEQVTLYQNGALAWGTEPSGVSAKSLNTILYSVYPNPATEIVTVESKEDLQDSTIIISDLAGKHVQTIEVDESSTSVSFNVSELKVGIYVISVDNQNVQQATMLVIE